MCTRCEDRGILCEYVPSQRSGRRSITGPDQANPFSTTTAPRSAPPQSSPLKARSTTFTTFNPALNTSLGFHAAENGEFADFRIRALDSEYLPQWGTGTLPTPTTDGSVYGSAGLSPSATSCTYSPISNSGFVPMDISLNGGPEPDIPTGFDALEFYRDESSKIFKVPPERPHSCLSLALDNLSILYIAPPTCTLASISPCMHKSLTTDYIICRNKKIIESISIMLGCSCSLDGSLAFIIALITFQVLAWYDAAVKDVDGDQTNASAGRALEQIMHIPIAVRKDQSESIQHRRMRAQLILNELNCVGGFVKHLSQRFKEARAQAEINLSTEKSGLDAGGIRIGHLSGSILVQLEADIKQRLHAVAKNTMEILGG